MIGKLLDRFFPYKVYLVEIEFNCGDFTYERKFDARTEKQALSRARAWYDTIWGPFTFTGAKVLRIYPKEYEVFS